VEWLDGVDAVKIANTPPLQDIHAMTDQEQLAGYDEAGTGRTLLMSFGGLACGGPPRSG
jgi:hypothetical protein